MSTRQHGAGVLVALALLGAMVAGNVTDQRPACSPERVASLQGGLSYAEGFRASLVASGQDSAQADRNVVATQAALAQCGVVA